MAKANRKAIDNSQGFNIRFVHGLLYPKFNFKRSIKIKKDKQTKHSHIRQNHNKKKKINKLIKKEQQIQYGFDLAYWWMLRHE